MGAASIGCPQLRSIEWPAVRAQELGCAAPLHGCPGDPILREFVTGPFAFSCYSIQRAMQIRRAGAQGKCSARKCRRRHRRSCLTTPGAQHPAPSTRSHLTIRSCLRTRPPPHLCAPPRRRRLPRTSPRVRPRRAKLLQVPAIVFPNLAVAEVCALPVLHLWRM